MKTSNNAAWQKFKIDLIVWKCNSSNSDLNNFAMFKIDLIVWKFLQEIK